MRPLIWMPEDIVSACGSDADRHYPLESGGALLGYRTDGAVVVTAMIEGGPAAVRTSTSYEPDLLWQNAGIAEHYQRSGRRDEFLGDWHSHPDTADACLSGDDRAVLKKIIRTPAARAAEPIMCILAGSLRRWNISAWRARLLPRFLVGHRLSIEEADVRRFRRPAV